jgi:hypothetical protein
MRIGSGLRLTVVLATAALLPLATGNAAAAIQSPGIVAKGTTSVLTAAQVERLAAHATQRSIIIFRNQLTGLPAKGATASARIQAANADQAGVLAELRQAHATHVHSFHIINAISATISSAEAARLRHNSAVISVVPDAVRHFASLGGGPGPAIPAMTRHHRRLARRLSQQTCPANPSQPLVEPEARQVMNVDAANQLVDGRGITVGIIADGIDPNLPDLIRPDNRHVLIDYQDFSGFGPGAPTDGREAFLDAGTIASQGNQTYDLAGFVNPAHPLPPGCNIKIEGIAPGASLAVLNVAGSSPTFFNSQIIQAIDWAVLHDHVNVLTEAFAGNPVPDTQKDPVALANRAAVAAGVSVVVGSGDAGPFDNIGSPASTPAVIAVGATTTYQEYVQTTSSATQFGTGWENNNIAALSSGGITEFNPHTVDVVAPGDTGWALCSPNLTMFRGCADPDHGASPGSLMAAGGTSASAAETAGTAALVMEAYAENHHGALPSPALVERVIVSTATDLGAPADHQGAGLVNALKAVRLALSIGASSRRGSTLLLSKTSLNATVQAGKKATFSVSVTNEGTRSQTVTPTVSGRPTTVSADSGTVTLSSGSPTFLDGSGNTDGFAIHQFTVPAGAGNLNGNITWNDQSARGAVFETLFDPLGNAAITSLLGTNQSGFGHVEVRKPKAGTWTAVIFTVSNAQYVGPVKFSYSTERFNQTGTVSPASRRLAPGQTGVFTVSLTVSEAGDRKFKLHLGTGGSTDGSIPIIVRALVPLTATGGSFNGELTGGAANFSEGQELTYKFNMAAHKPSLNVGIRVAGPGYTLEGFLIDPKGQPLDAQTTSNDHALPGRTMQFFHRTPVAGRWTLVLVDIGFDDGAHLSEPFTGKISFTPPAVTSSGIPNSPTKVLQAGHPVKATITVTNTGNSAKDFFVDPRLVGKVLQTLAGSDVNNVTLPLPMGEQPSWLVPSRTTLLDVVARATVPITMDVSWLFADPDVLGNSSADRSAASLSAPEIAPGLFLAFPQATGPFTSGTTGTVNLTAVARTNPFDSAVTSTTGDAWLQSVKPSAPYSLLTLNPGGKGTIKLTITPNAPKGTVIHGFITVDTINLATASGDELVDIPYSYKVG